MKQQTFSDIEYSYYKKTTKREEFLDAMDSIIPWDYWVNLIRPYYPSGKIGRPPKGIEIMLRMNLLKSWFSLSDIGIEDAIHECFAQNFCLCQKRLRRRTSTPDSLCRLFLS